MASFDLIGRIDPFDKTIESWGNYVERLEQYFEANEVENTKKVSSLLTLIGGKTYSLLIDLTFNKHLLPKPLIIAERYRFYKGTGYEYDGNVFVTWVLQVRRAEVVTK